MNSDYIIKTHEELLHLMICQDDDDLSALYHLLNDIICDIELDYSNLLIPIPGELIDEYLTIYQLLLTNITLREEQILVIIYLLDKIDIDLEINIDKYMLYLIDNQLFHTILNIKKYKQLLNEEH